MRSVRFLRTTALLVMLVGCGGPRPTVPMAPTQVVAVGGDRQAVVTWHAPPDPGSPILGYTVFASPGEATASVMGPEATVTGLVNGARYTFTVVARNAMGEGATSLPSRPVTPLGVPGAPRAVTAVSGVGSALVAWKEPSDNGGSEVMGYVVTSNPGAVVVTSVAKIDNKVNVTGLVPGTRYTFTVAAKNAVGVGPASAPSDEVTTAKLPGAPPSVIAMAGDARATVSWTAPSDDGGGPITGYQVFNAASALVATTMGETQAVVTGLPNGTGAAFFVRAGNAVGLGPPSPFSNTVTPVGAPGAPTSVVASAGIGKASLSWTPPANTGGSPVVEYVVTSNPAGYTANTAAPQATVLGLVNGTSYRFTVTARNIAGSGPPSVPSNAVTPAAVPGAPTVAYASAGNAQAVVSWVAPLDDGGAPVTSYVVTSSPGGLTATAVGTTQVAVTGLTNGTLYTFTVRAKNVAGLGPPSLSSNAVTPITVPGPPSGVTATEGNGSSTISWTPPADTGGAAITGYAVTASPGGLKVSTTATTATLSGLTNGTTYTFTVTASNPAGVGPPSAPSSPATPGTQPGPPGNVLAVVTSSTEVTVTWTPPTNDGGRPITGYQVTSIPGGVLATTGFATLTVVMGGLTTGVAYQFAVHAKTQLGAGPNTLSNGVTPSVAPGAPTAVTAIPGDGQAVVSWTPPADTGGAPITQYVVTTSAGGLPLTVGAVTQTAVAGLVNGQSYTFTVRAKNSAGVGPDSAPSSPVTPSKPPQPPTTVVATAGVNGTATVTWAAPVDDGGNAVIRYVLRSLSTGAVWQTALTQLTVTAGFEPSHTFTVTAVNAVGSSSPSAPSNTLVMPGPVCAGTLAMGGALPFLETMAPPVASIAADFDGDGQMDLVNAYAAPENTITVHRGRGNGTFFPSVTLVLPLTTFTTFTVGDFTSDGFLDVAAGTSGGVIGLFAGNGDGTFQPRVDSMAFQVPARFANADFNGDGARDLAGVGATAVFVQLGNGNGTFQTATSLGTLPAGTGTSVIAADFSGDGKTDLAVLNGPDIQLRLGNGDGTFQAPVTTSANAGLMVAGHFNADSHLDLVVLTNSTSVGLYLGVGDGTFQPEVAFTTPIPTGAEVGDFNGDALMDLAVISTGGVTMLFGSAGGTFQPAVTYPLAQTQGLAAADFSSDGKLDLALGIAGLPVVRLLHNDGNGTFALPAPSLSTAANPISIVSADLNGDTRPDLVVAEYTGSIGIAFGNPNGTFQALAHVPVGGSPNEVATSDLNADGNLDVVVVNRSGNAIQVLLGDGTGAFAPSTTYPVGGEPLGVACADFDADGDIDLAVTRYSGGNVALLTNTGSGTFDAPVTLPFGVPGPTSILAHDFNGDGRPDLAVAAFVSGSVTVLLATGPGTFQLLASYPVGPNPHSVTTGDYDADGKSDLAVANFGSSTVSVLFRTSTGFLPQVTHSTGLNPTSVVTADVDRDGDLDLVVANAGSNTVTVLRGSGTGAFVRQSYPVGLSPYGLAVNDFNGDRSDDVATADFGASTVTVVLRTACVP